MHLVQTLNAAQLCQNVCHSIEKCVQGNFTKKSYLAFLYSLTRRNTPTNYRSQGIRVPGLQPWTKRVETHLQKISIFFLLSQQKLKPSPKGMTVSPLPLSKLFKVTPELYTLVSRPKLHVFNRGYWEGSYFFCLEEMVVSLLNCWSFIQIIIVGYFCSVICF